MIQKKLNFSKISILFLPLLIFDDDNNDINKIPKEFLFGINFKISIRNYYINNTTVLTN